MYGPGRTRDYECALCEKAFFAKGDLQRRHINTHTKEKGFQCDQCNFATANNSVLARHQTSVHQENSAPSSPKMRKYKCKLCDYRAKCRFTLLDHVRTHGSDRSFACPVQDCRYKSKTYGTLWIHRRRHEKEKPHKCSYEGCNYASVTRPELQNHVRCRHTKERPFQCTSCSFKTAHLSSLISHRWTHQREQGENDLALNQHKCQFCDYRSPFYGNLVRHARRHTGEKPFACTVQGCSYTSMCKSNVMRHRQTHPELMTQLYKCEKCEFQTRHQVSLQNHQQAHADERPFACDFPGCSFRSNWSAGLRMHRRTHLSRIESNQFSCPFINCQFKTVYKYSLQSHLLIHGNDKRYSCDLCDYRGKTRNHLYGHKNYRHPANPNRTFECPLCNKLFFTNANMKMHLRIHTRERLLNCPVDCNYATLTRFNLSRHICNRHPEAGPLKCHRTQCSYRSDCFSDMSLHRSKAHGEVRKGCRRQKQSADDYSLPKCYVPVARVRLVQ